MRKIQIVHRDLKPQNILMATKDPTNLEVKVTDFGFSCFSGKDNHLDLKLGTLPFMAPELVAEGKTKYNEKVDIWSIGVITYMLVTGFFPFSPEGSKKDLKDRI